MRVSTFFQLLLLSSPVLISAQCVSGTAVHMIVARGTTEDQNSYNGTGLMHKIVESVQGRLKGSWAEGVVYPATLNQPSSNSAGNLAMTNQITAYAQACPNSKIVLMGYSQGAQVLGDTVSGGGTWTPNTQLFGGGPGGPTDPTPPLASNLASKGKLSRYAGHNMLSKVPILVIAMILVGDPTRIRNPAYDKDQTGCTVNAVSLDFSQVWFP